jgi:chemotaxis protein CheC
MQQLTEERIDALQELINIGIGRAASILNEMLESRIILQVPSVKVLDFSQLQQELIEKFADGQLAAVRLSFTGSFSGTAELVFPTESASVLVALLTGEELGTPDLDSVKIGTLTEIGNIAINGVMGSISNVLNQRMNYTLPIYTEDSIEKLLQLNNYRFDELISQDVAKLEVDSTVFLLAQARFTIEQLEIIGDIILIFETSSFDVLIKAIDKLLGVPL